MQDIPRYTVTYCQYGDIRMKPTDIWTNHPHPQFKPMCKPRDNCHESSPRGGTIRSWRDKGIYLGYNGTTGLKNKVERAKIPDELCEHIVDICEGKEVKLAQIDIFELLGGTK